MVAKVSSEIKLWKVSATCEIEYVVAAENRSEAADMGRQYFHEAYRDDYLTEPDVHVIGNIANHLDLPEGYESDSPPYGDPDISRQPISAWLSPQNKTNAAGPEDDEEQAEEDDPVKPLPGQRTLFGDVIE